MSRVLIDACVLYGTLTRAIVLDLARSGWFVPLWTPRILDEWHHAAAREGAIAADEVTAEIARLRASFPKAEILPAPGIEAQVSLPDPADAHVLAGAISGGADELLTANLKDFPTRTLVRHGILRRAPDEFLLEAFHAKTQTVSTIVAHALADATARGVPGSPRAILKRARLSRLGKALYPAASGG